MGALIMNLTTSTAAADPAASLLCSGHAACPGCIDALSARYVLDAMGPDTVAVIPPSCMAIIAGPQPYSSLKIPVYQPTLESSAAAATGVRRALDAQGKRETQVVVLAGDGGTADIGFQCLSSAAERDENILYVCLDNEGYMNTGAQKSSSTPQYARTGSTPAGKLTRKKNMSAIMAAHGVPYVATASIGHLADLRRKVAKAKAIRGMRFITLLIPCLDGWGVADDGALTTARHAVESGAFPLYEIEDGRRYTLNHTERSCTLSSYLSLQRRYRHLTAEQIDSLQAGIDEAWADLLQRTAASKTPAN
mgnify:FL=1